MLVVVVACVVGAEVVDDDPGRVGMNGVVESGVNLLPSQLVVVARVHSVVGVSENLSVVEIDVGAIVVVVGPGEVGARVVGCADVGACVVVGAVVVVVVELGRLNFLNLNLDPFSCWLI